MYFSFIVTFIHLLRIFIYCKLLNHHLMQILSQNRRYIRVKLTWDGAQIGNRLHVVKYDSLVLSLAVIKNEVESLPNIKNLFQHRL